MVNRRLAQPNQRLLPFADFVGKLVGVGDAFHIDLQVVLTRAADRQITDVDHPLDKGLGYLQIPNVVVLDLRAVLCNQSVYQSGAIGGDLQRCAHILHVQDAHPAYADRDQDAADNQSDRIAATARLTITLWNNIA